MLTFVSNIPIFRRLFLAFVLAAVIPGIVIFVLGTFFINTLTSRSQVLQTNIQAVQAVTTTGSYLPDMQTFFDTLVNHQGATSTAYTGTSDAMSATILGNIANLETHFDNGVKDFQQRYVVASSPNMSMVNAAMNADDPGGQLVKQQQNAINTVMETAWPRYRQQQDLILNEIKAGQTVSPQQIQAARQSYNTLATQWKTVSSTTEQINSIITKVGPSQINPIILGIVIAFLCTIMIVVTIGYIVNLTITRPLRQLAMLTRRIARGETSARAELTGRDEISMVANSMNNMLDNIVRLIQETQGQRDNLQGQVEKLVSEVSGVGEGDLRVQAEVTADTLGVLADSFNYMVEELSSLIIRVKMVANEVEKFTTSVLDRMNQLVESGDIQLAQITEASREVERMTAASREVAERAQALHDVAREAHVNAQDGREALQQAVEGMGRINDNVQATASKVQILGERSREINEIVDAIAGIAHQTNRLALDAAIQAAMAGENGKGFSAVAADIRRLAERAKEQTTSIGQIVRSVREDIGAAAQAMQDTQRETAVGARLTQEAGVALESVFTVVERQAREIEYIDQMAMQQMQSSRAVANIMHGVSNATLQNGASTREASQYMERLARSVEQMRSSVEAFKLRENQEYYPADATISIEEEGSPMTVSGIFRTVSATAIPSSGSLNGLPPARSAPGGYDPFGFSTVNATGQSTPREPLRSGSTSSFPPSREHSSNGKNGNLHG